MNINNFSSVKICICKNYYTFKVDKPMSRITIHTTMTNPEERKDPWKEALNCYHSFADEVITEGQDWPEEFKFEDIGKYFQKGFDKAKGDWVIRMDLDYFFHENDFIKIRNFLKKYSDMPAVAFPQYQFFTPDRYQLKTKICIAINKKMFPNIRLNGGGDLTLPTLNGNLIRVSDVPNINVPIYQYESTFKTKTIISNDRARFARAWARQFGDYGDRGGETPDLAYEAWFSMIKERYAKHTFSLNIEKHPSFIKDRLEMLEKGEFGHDAFGLKDNTSRKLKNYIKGYKEKYI